jgi:hypothetical protein
MFIAAKESNVAIARFRSSSLKINVKHDEARAGKR